MTINLHVPERNELLRPTITVIGVGGAGGNAVNNMIASSLEGVNFVVANTDAQALDHSLAQRTIQLGAGITKGLGAGANPEVGRAAAEEAREEIAASIDGSNMVFIAAGMGGGTGTGAASVVARIAKDLGALTVAVVTKPFQFEGAHRMRLAESGLKELHDFVDTLIVIPNQNLFCVANERTTFADAFKMADEVLHSGVRGVTDLMVRPGMINLDFADIRAVMREMGKAMMGTGEASGDRRAVEAAEAAISNPLLDDVSLKGARALLINITGGPDMTLFEVDEAANRVREEVDPEANIIFGSTFSEEMQGKIRVSVVATGIDAQQHAATAPAQAAAPKFVQEQRRPYAFAGAPVKTETVKPQVRMPSFDRTPASAAPESARPQPQPQPEPQRMQPVAPAPRVETQQEQHAPVVAAAAPQVAAPVVAVAPAPASVPAPEPKPTPTLSRELPQRVAPPPVQRREAPKPQEEDEQNARSFFKRMADVGRALSTREESPKPQLSDRVQIVSKPASHAQAEASEKSAKPAVDDQYLDIPAFLRRQAN